MTRALAAAGDAGRRGETEREKRDDGGVSETACVVLRRTRRYAVRVSDR